MPAVTVERARGRYHLPPSGREAQERLDQMLPRVLDTHLEAALRSAGVGDHEVVCIDRLDVRVRMHLGSPDASLVADWGSALSDAVRERLGSPDEGLVRYRSKGGAILDAVLASSQGRVERAWAWRQIGFWDAPDGASAERVAAAAAMTLLSDPTAIVPVLVEVARRGSAFNRVVRGWTPRTWESLARAALVAASSPTAVLDASPGAELVDLAPIPPRQSRSMTTTRDGDGREEPTRARRGGRDPAVAETRRAQAVLGGSVILRRTGQLSGLDPTVIRCLVVMGALEVDPTALRSPPAFSSAIVEALERGVVGSAPGLGSPRIEAGSRDGGPVPAAWASEGSEQDGHGADRASAEARSRVEKPTEADGQQVAAYPYVPVAPVTPASPSDLEPLVEHEPPVELVVGELARTRFGGLLFALHVLADLGVEDLVASDGRLASRSIRWVMQHLGLALVATDARDPAVLALCGLAPEAESPSAGQRPATPHEEAAVRDLTHSVERGVAARLGREELGEEALLALWSRPATVSADPGWIELCFELGDASVDVRKSGLDTDPDYVRWLGVVVRFVYA